MNRVELPFVFSLHFVCKVSCPGQVFIKTRMVHARFVLVWSVFLQGVAAWARTSLVVHVLFCLCWVNCHELSILF